MDWSELIKLGVAGMFGVMANDLRKHLSDLRTNKYRWECPHQSCNLTVKSNKSGTIVRVKQAHFQQEPTHKP